MPLIPTLTATPDVVIVDIEAGQTAGTTQIEYSKEQEQRIWHRWKSGAWQKVSLQVTAPDDPALRHGYFASPALQPGWVYEVQVWAREVDPNRIPQVDQPPRALASLMVFALRKRPERRNFLSDENQSAGGTYREHQVVTTTPVYAYMAVSNDPPIDTGGGHFIFGKPSGITWAPMAQSFFLTITDLLPGTHYYELTRLSDDYGNWEFVQREFTTLKRRIRFEPTDLYINDDSDDLSNGEGSFWFSLETGSISAPSGWSTRGTLSYSNGNLETGKSVTPAPSGDITFGPEVVSASSRDLRVSVKGQEKDTPGYLLAEDDHATGTKDLWQPSGTVDEDVIQRVDSVRGEGSDDLAFTLSFKYWVEYF